MNWAKLDDGRLVIVDSAKQQVSVHRGEPCPPGYVNVLLSGNWQTMKRDRLLPAPFGSPFQEVLNEK